MAVMPWRKVKVVGLAKDLNPASLRDFRRMKAAFSCELVKSKTLDKVAYFT